MKLQQLRFLDAVVRNNLNVSSAAEELFTSQPGVSHQIKLLEDELDIQIFERSGKKLTGITPAGYAILEHVGELLNNAQNIKQAALEFSKNNRGSLTIATTHTQAKFILPRVLQRFSTRYPNIELRVHQGNPTSICQLAANNQVDFVIASEIIDEFGELINLPVYRWNRYIVVQPDHPLTRLKKISLEHLVYYPILTYMMGLSGQSKLDLSFQAANLEPKVAFTATDSDIVKTYVKMGLGVGIIAEMACADKDPDFVYINAAHLFPESTIKIGFRHSRHLSNYQFDFLQMILNGLDRNLIENVAHTRSTQEREKMLEEIKVPQYRDTYKD